MSFINHPASLKIPSLIKAAQMVTKGTTAQAAKRKKTDEMAESPPKRVTRARTAKTTDGVDLASNSAKPARAPKLAAAEKKRPPTKALTAPKKASTTKRKTRGDDEVEAFGDGPAPQSKTEDQSKSKPVNSRSSRNRAPAPLEEAKAQVIDAPKPRSRQAKAAPAENAAATTSTRTTKERTTEPAIKQQATDPVKTATRGRTAATRDGTNPKATTRARATKKVQFQEETDKENVPLETEGPKETVKSAMKPTGIRAKPVRKPATTRTSTRGRKAPNDRAKEQLPLSPKKANQVAKAGSTSSEDELAGGKTPISSPKKSTIKLQTSPVRIVNTTTTPASPSKSSPAANRLSSPARRPPPSPFKDGFRMSPKKVDINFGIEPSILQSTSNETPAKSSLLQESPRKMVLQKSTARPMLLASQSPLKSSLLQSPARRPMPSAFKSPKKASNASTSKEDSPVKLHKPPKPMHFSPEQTASSPLRVAGSPEGALPAQKTTPNQQRLQPVFKILSPAMSDSPERPVPSDLASLEATVDADIDTTMQDVQEIVPDQLQEVVVDRSSSAFAVTNEAFRRVSMESGSTDELASPDKKYAPTPLRRGDASYQDFATPTTLARAATIADPNSVSFTPLLGKINSWSASSPKKQDEAKISRLGQGMFSFGAAAAAALKEESPLKVTSPVKTSFFDDELAVMDKALEQTHECVNEVAEDIADSKAAHTAMQLSMESQASEEYGDENAAPTEAEILREEQDNGVIKTCTPAKVFNIAKITPAKAITLRPEEVHTISKVPLRASAEDSPLKVTRQRSKSMGGSFSVAHEPSVPTPATTRESLPCQPETPKLVPTKIPHTPSSGMKLDPETPGRTVRKDVVAEVLKGAIVYVDVHTTEGADASSIFVDLLNQMGARCVKQWAWNPRTSRGGSLADTTTPRENSPGTSPATGRIGITHVVYKDGGQRTLQKVRQSAGLVSCVGVGWVLE